MVVAGGGGRQHLMDQRTALLLEQVTEAVLLGGEELIEGRLGNLGLGHDLFDRRRVVAASRK
jgi:hypothetical protein